ncbi:DNA pilot protein [Microvirus sp.]|nr:DNA pilot protein [Microvirus sp.]
MGKILGTLGSAALSGLTGGVGGLISGAISGIGSLLGIGSRKKKIAREAEEREYKRQLEYMGLQAQYNKEQAKYTTELAKDMWEYTNYPNQVKQLEKAGLNPALLYGQGGGGGSAAGGGTAAGVGLPSSTGVGMGIQWQQMEAQKRLTEAEAAKANAEAAKLMTVDTEKTSSETEKNKQDIKESEKRIEQMTSQIHKTNEESKTLEFNNWLNELKKSIKLQGEVNGKTIWSKGFGDLFKENELQKMLAEYGISQKQYNEAKNDKEIAIRLSDALDEIANGKIAVFGKMVEEAKQAKNETAIQRWQFEQDKALSDLINSLSGDGKYGKLITAVVSAIFGKWAGFGKTKRE